MTRNQLSVDSCPFHQAMEGLDPLYFLNEHDIDKEVFRPVFDCSTNVCCMMGYFTSKSLSELASSLSHFLKNPHANIRLVVSPHLESSDLHAMRVAVEANENLLEYLFPGFKITEDNLRTRCVIALAYLVATKRIVFRVAIQNRGIFHTKCWLFETSLGRITIHGSGNMTKGGLSINTEQISIDKEWDDDRSKKVVRLIHSTFQRLWGDSYPGVRTISLNGKTVDFLSNISKDNEHRFSWETFIDEKLYENDNDDSGERFSLQRLEIPIWLNYQSGAYSHQGEAVSAWLQHNSGILSIATGGGKTLTSLIIAAQLTTRLRKLFIVVAAPTLTLLEQWSNTIRKFNVEPIDCRGLTGSTLKRRINEKLRNLRRQVSRNEILVVTHDALKQNVFDFIQRANKDIPTMLIGDEVHNMGSQGFRLRSKDIFDYRLGLSATYERQFDEDGTQFLRDYFGDMVYEFTTSDAIGKCLVPFEYHVHGVHLNDDEQEEWSELTYEIRRLSYTSELPDGSSAKERWKLLCLRRRRIVESANAKLDAFEIAIPRERHLIRRTLVFCTDKNPDQLTGVNHALINRSINFHQVTQEETSNPHLLERIISAFSIGELQVLTSKRVLDEGFDAPQAETAYLLASHTVRRQWVQRLGRILRLSESTEKTQARIHDFVVFPCEQTEKPDADFASLIRSEVERILFFSNLSLNGLESGGAMDIVSQLTRTLEE